MNEQLFPLIAKQNGFYKDLTFRNLKWLHEMFRDGRLDEDVYLTLTEFNHKMEESASRYLKAALKENTWTNE